MIYLHPDSHTRFTSRYKFDNVLKLTKILETRESFQREQQLEDNCISEKVSIFLIRGTESKQ